MTDLVTALGADRLVSMVIALTDSEDERWQKCYMPMSLPLEILDLPEEAQQKFKDAMVELALAGLEVLAADHDARLTETFVRPWQVALRFPDDDG